MLHNFRFHFVVWSYDGSVVSYVVPMKSEQFGGAAFGFPGSAPLYVRAERCLRKLSAAAVVVCKAFASGSFLPVAAYVGGSHGGCVFASVRGGSGPSPEVSALLSASVALGRAAVGRQVVPDYCEDGGSRFGPFVSSLPVVVPFRRPVPSGLPLGWVAAVRLGLAGSVMVAAASVPSSPSVAPSAASVAPSSPVAPSVAPSAASVAPSSPSVAPSAASVPVAPSVAPSSPSVAPSSPSVAPSAASVAPSAASVPLAPSVLPRWLALRLAWVCSAACSRLHAAAGACSAACSRFLAAASVSSSAPC